MENRMLYCYKRWLEKRDGNIFKQISKLPVMGVILLFLLFVGLIGFLVLLAYSVGGKNYQTATLVLAVAYGALGIITSIYCERYQVKHSKQGMKNYKEHCDKLMENVLRQNGFSEDFIPTLIDRFNTMINNIEEKIKIKHDHLNKFMEMLLIPISVVILGSLLDKGENTNEALGLGLSGIIIILLIYAVAVFVLFLYDFVMRLPQGKYKEFVTDLQSILDFKKCENDTESNDPVTNSTLTEASPENEEPQTQTIR